MKSFNTVNELLLQIFILNLKQKKLLFFDFGEAKKTFFI